MKYLVMCRFIPGFLCYKCALDASKLKPPKPCNHRPLTRSFVATYNTNEIAYAFKLGYQFHFFELAIFHTTEKILTRFTTALIFELLRHCDYPLDCTEDGQKEQYLQSLNSELKFEEHLGKILNIQNVLPNAQLRDVKKRLLNSFLGYFSLNLKKHVQTKFVTEYSTLASQINQGNVSSFCDFGRAIQVMKKAPFRKRRGNLKGNVMVSFYKMYF